MDFEEITDKIMKIFGIMLMISFNVLMIIMIIALVVRCME